MQESLRQVRETAAQSNLNVQGQLQQLAQQIQSQSFSSPQSVALMQQVARTATQPVADQLSLLRAASQDQANQHQRDLQVLPQAHEALRRQILQEVRDQQRDLQRDFDGRVQQVTMQLQQVTTQLQQLRDQQQQDHQQNQDVDGKLQHMAVQNQQLTAQVQQLTMQLQAAQQQQQALKAELRELRKQEPEEVPVQSTRALKRHKAGAHKAAAKADATAAAAGSEAAPTSSVSIMVLGVAACANFVSWPAWSHSGAQGLGGALGFGEVPCGVIAFAAAFAPWTVCPQVQPPTYSLPLATGV